MAKLFIRAEEMTAPAHGECGRRPSDMEIGGAEGGAAAPSRAYEELCQHWLKTRAVTDTAEQAVDHHRGMVSDQPLLAKLASAPVRDDLATMMEQVFQRLDLLEAPSHHSGGRGGGRGRGSHRGGRGRSNSFVRRSFANQRSMWPEIARKRRKSRRKAKIEVHRRPVTRQQHR